ncbi:MAG: hypothetical protein IJT02_00180 [Synergistaceae bacterium]|nr:hypothetical protein [Synergistaceae bacterium]
MRLFITTLSLLSMIGFGYALAGYGTSLLGNPVRVDYVVGGLAAGFACAGLALGLWYWKRRDFYDYDDDNAV